MRCLLYSPVFYFGGVSALASSLQVPSRADWERIAQVCRAAGSHIGRTRKSRRPHSVLDVGVGDGD